MSSEAKSVHVAMSESGQTRTSADVCDTTASPLEVDMTGSPRDVAEGGNSDRRPVLWALPSLWRGLREVEEPLHWPELCFPRHRVG